MFRQTVGGLHPELSLARMAQPQEQRVWRSAAKHGGQEEGEGPML